MPPITVRSMIRCLAVPAPAGICIPLYGRSVPDGTELNLTMMPAPRHGASFLVRANTR